jgi:hypothetical protein
MKRILLPLVAFAIRHWLRIGLAALALVLLSRQQLRFHVQLGGGAPAEVAEEGHRQAGVGSLLSLVDFFGGSEATRDLERVDRLADLPVDAFLTRFAHVAQAEQQKFGVPASIVLAAGLLGSEAGTSETCQTANTYFNLPVTADWSGEHTKHGGRSLRSYETAWTSFRDFSLYLDAQPYRQLRALGSSDYRKWAAGLEELGLLDRPGLAAELIATIDRYQLFRYD